MGTRAGETGRRAAIAAAFRASGRAYAADAFSGVARLLDRYVNGWSTMYTDACEATNVRGEQSAEVLDLRMSCLRDRWSEVHALSDVLAQADGEMVSNAVKATAALSSLDGCADVRTLRESLPPPRDPKTRQIVDSLRGRLAAAKALSDAGKLNEALASAAALVAEARGVSYRPVLAEALARLAMVQLRLRRPTEAEKNLDEAIWVGTASRHDELVAEASIDQIYNIGYLQRDFSRADRWIHQAEAYMDRLGGHNLLRAWMENNVGTVLDARGDLDQAAVQYRRALTIKERVLGPKHPDVAMSLNNLALTLSSGNRREEALGMFNRGIDIIGETLGWQHVDMALQLANRAELLNQLGRYADGRRDAARAVAIYEREVGANNPELQFVLELLGEAELGLERPELAIAPLERAMEMIAGRTNTVLGVDGRKTALELARALWNGGGDRQRAKELAALAARPGVAGLGSDEERRVIASANTWNTEHAIEVATARRSQLRSR